jgi:integrase/recombinase XerD
MVKSSFISSSKSTSGPAPSSTSTIAPDPARVNSTVPTQRTGTELRQRFTTYLILQQKAHRTVEAYVSWIRHLAAFHKRSPDTLGNAEIQAWFLHLITERRLSASTINLAINAVRSFHGGFLGQDIEPLLRGIKRPARKPQPPRVFSSDEIERLINVGTAGDPLARVFLMTVFGCGLRLSEATHVQISDIDSARLQLRVSHPKGGRERLTLLSPALVLELRQWYRVHKPVRWLFSQGLDQEPICKGTAQNLFYRSLRRSGLKKKLGIHSLRHTFATLLLENAVEITVVQKLLGHANLSTTARYLHVRKERLGQIRSPLGLLNLSDNTKAKRQ